MFASDSTVNHVGRDGALIKSKPFDRSVVGSNPGLDVTYIHVATLGKSLSHSLGYTDSDTDSKPGCWDL